jgi:hypothetical protein
MRVAGPAVLDYSLLTGVDEYGCIAREHTVRGEAVDREVVE